MLDRTVMPISERLLGRPARALHRRGVTANQVTFAGFAIGLLAVPALALNYYLVALALILLNRLADGLDGAIARIAGPTSRGAYFDIALDFFFYSSIPFGFALANPTDNALPASLLLLSFVGTGSSFLSFSTIAAKRGLTSKHLPNKGLYYLGGLAEGTETIGFLILVCLLPHNFPVLAYTFGAFALATTAGRWVAGWRAFGDERKPTAPQGPVGRVHPETAVREPAE